MGNICGKQTPTKTEYNRDPAEKTPMPDSGVVDYEK